MLSIYYIPTTAVHCHDDVEAILRESLKMRDFNHPHVLSLIGVSLDAGDSPYIVMPFMANGSLLNHLRKERPNLTIDDKAPEELVSIYQKNVIIQLGCDKSTLQGFSISNNSVLPSSIQLYTCIEL